MGTVYILGIITIFLLGVFIGVVIGILRTSSIWKKQIRTELGLDSGKAEECVINKMKKYE